jgi:exopolysaccharide production protein ExoZ
LPLYWIATAALFALSLWEHWIFLDPVTPPRLVPWTLFSLLLIPVYPGPVFLPPGWTLYYEMQFYVLFGLTLRWSRPIALCAIIGVLFILALIGVTRLCCETLSYGFGEFWLSPLTLEFVWGIGIGILYARGVRLATPVALACSVVGLVATLFPAYFAVPPGFAVANRELTVGLPAALLLLGIINLPQIPPGTKMGTLTMWLGDASYALYLIHWTVFLGLREQSTVLLLALAVVGAFLVRVVIEAPLLRLLQRPRMPDAGRLRPLAQRL